MLDITDKNLIHNSSVMNVNKMKMAKKTLYERCYAGKLLQRFTQSWSKLTGVADLFIIVELHTCHKL